MATAVSEVSKVHGGSILLTRDDITLLEVDAFVYYATHDLKLGAGHGTAISARAGREVQRELDELGPVATCDVVSTGAGKLPAKHIIHAVGPRFKEPDLEAKLARTMANVLAEARSLDVRRLAFPPMGAGYYGVPTDLSAGVMLEALEGHLGGDGWLDEVIISVLDTDQYQTFESAMNARGAGRLS